jgi:hypothetical protein
LKKQCDADLCEGFEQSRAQFTTALGTRASHFQLQWAGQVMTTKDKIDTFEERRTELEKSAGEAFESVEVCEIARVCCANITEPRQAWYFASKEETDSILKNGFPATYKGDSVTFAVNPAVAIQTSKQTGDVSRNDQSINRVILCRVSLGKEGNHHRLVGKDEQLRYVITDVRGVIPSFVVGFRYQIDSSKDE